MITSEAQRTLVKSPPELSAELSDPAALARHLGELGEIRITRVQPEEKVEWEAEGASGTITIKPSGWGTKVTLSVTCDPAAAAAAQGAAGEDAAESAAEADAVVVAAPEAAEPAVSDPEAGAATIADADASAGAADQPEA